MIKLSHIYKRYDKQLVIRDISYEFPNRGLIAICGNSGCGKTTLLNIMAGLIEHEGEVVVGREKLNEMSDTKRSEFRIRHFGFIYQDFKLFESESVFHNIIFPLETLFKMKRKEKIRKCKDLLSLVGLDKQENNLVNTLSGGEKQRVAIARSLVNDPDVIFADEPTGSLDASNSNKIMDLLRQVSKNSLVIVVSHDYKLMESYANSIIKMEDGTIIESKQRNISDYDRYLPLKRNTNSNKKSKVPFLFLLRHTKGKIKEKKARTFILTSMMSLGLVGVGFSIMLTSNISNNIKSAYSSVIKDNRILVGEKNPIAKNDGRYSASFDEVTSIMNSNDYETEYIGTTYFNDFENSFIDANYCTLVDAKEKFIINGLSARSINDFTNLIYCRKTIYPETKFSLLDNEIILGLTIKNITDICYHLRIKRSVESLSAYLEENKIPIVFNFENLDWNFSDEQIFDVVGFTLETKNLIYHSNSLWNETVFEKMMMFPVSNNLFGILKKPWMLRKAYYLYINNRDDFLINSLYDLSLQKFIFESFSPDYIIDDDTYVLNKCENRLLVFKNNIDGILPFYAKELLKFDNRIKNPIFGSSTGYFIYPSTMIMGFANFMYFAPSITKLNETIDIKTNLSSGDNEESILPSQVLTGHYSMSMDKGVVFDTVPDNLLKGRKPKDFTEICISSEMANNLFGNEEPINKFLYIAYTNSEQEINGKIHRDFITDKLLITGLVRGNKNSIYHRSEWSLLYFQSRLYQSRFNLPCSYISFEVSKKSELKDVVNNINNSFPYMTAFDPLEDFNSGVDEVCHYLQIALSIFSIVSTIISIILLAISNYLYILENKSEIGLVRCIGVRKSESIKFMLVHSLYLCGKSFIYSCLEIFFISFLFNHQLNSLLGGNNHLSFNPFALIIMLIFAVVSSICSTYTFSHKLYKINPIEALKS